MKKLTAFIVTCTLCFIVFFRFPFWESFRFLRKVFDEIGLNYKTERPVVPPRFADSDPVPPPPYPPPPPPG